MLLRERLLDLARARGKDTFSTRRVEAALRTIEQELGSLDVGAVAEDLRLAQTVTVAGDDAVWIVFGQWEDGTMDLIREQGMFPQDTLVGWRPGQTYQEFHKELAAEPLLEIPKDAKGKQRPLFGDGANPGRSRK